MIRLANSRPVLPIPLIIFLHIAHTLLRNTYWTTQDPYGQRMITRIVEMTGARRETKVWTNSTRLKMRWER